MEIISQNLAESFIAAGVLMIAIEAAILGFATLFLLFLGAGSLLTGLAMSFGLIEPTMINGIASVAGISVALAIALWKPMKNMQANSVVPKNDKSDFMGLTFLLTSDLSSSALSSYRYSGIVWSVVPDSPTAEPIPAGTKVIVTGVDVGSFYVKPHPEE
ncbi:NfeD family protein [Alteromonadaceae bacterium BrNp21-10]|nr:NfeD family protein [Alteromonadaceae bacterium BrNp21-10]